MNVSLSSKAYLDNTGNTIIDLLNEFLLDQEDLVKLLSENEIVNPSQKLPGLIGLV